MYIKPESRDELAACEKYLKDCDRAERSATLRKLRL